MRNLLFAMFILVGCESSTSAVNLEKPVLKSPENSKAEDQSQQQGDTQVATQQNSGAQNQNRSEVKLAWNQFGKIPSDFVFPLQHFVSQNSEGFVAVDKNGRSFLIDTKEKSAVPLVLWAKLSQEPDTREIVQTSNFSAWHLRNDRLQWIRWEENGTDHTKIEVSLTDLFFGAPPQDMTIVSPRVDRLLVVGGDVRVHVQRVEDKLKVKRYSGVQSGELRFSSPTGHLFEYTNGNLKRLLEGQIPTLAQHTLAMLGLPVSAGEIEFDVFGTEQELEIVGLAVVDGYFWMSMPSKIGSTTSTILSQGTLAADQQFASVVEPFLVRHCGSCHEGRAPVFIRTEAGVKKALADVVIAQKEKIKFRVNLPQSDGRVMPPYAPFPSPEDLESIAKWLQ